MISQKNSEKSHFVIRISLLLEFEYGHSIGFDNFLHMTFCLVDSIENKENSPTGEPLGGDRGVVVLSLLQSSSQSQ